MQIQATDLSLRYDRTTVIDSISFSVESGGFASFIGPSGCGKTSLLNCIAGILKPSSGQLVNTFSKLSFVFQQDTLLGWKTVRDNIALPLQLENSTVLLSAQERDVEIGKLLDLVGLTGFGEYFPEQLSGGMKKRVELARALISKPDLLILDEPFSSVDILTRERLNLLVYELWVKTGTTVIMVTHSVEEACFLSNDVYIMSRSPSRIVDRCRLPDKEPVRTAYILNADELSAEREIRNNARELWENAGEDTPATAEKRNVGRFMASTYQYWTIPIILTIIIGAIALLKKAVPISDFLVPQPVKVFSRFFETIENGSIFPHLSMTVYESISGFIIAFFLSLIIGYVVGKSRLANTLLMPWLIAANTVPSIALMPFLNIWFGFGLTPKIIISVIIIFFPMLITNMNAFSLVAENLGMLIRFYKPGRFRKFWLFEFPGAIPIIMGGVKVSITFSVIGAVIGEFQSGITGLGALIQAAKTNFDTELMFVGLMWLMILGLSYYLVAHLVWLGLNKGRKSRSF